MRIFLQVLGTRGDVEIFLILGRELRRRGHRVILGSSPFYESMVTSADLEWIALGSGSRDELVDVMRALSPIEDQRRRVQYYVDHWLKPQLAEARAAVGSSLAAADYAINNLKMVWRKGSEIMPGATVSYDPPASAARVAHYAPQRIEHGGALLDLVAMNQALVDPDNAWPAAYQFTGFWFSKAAQDWRPDDELVDFVERETAPVVLTMGSMVMLDSATLVDKFRAALRECGRRGVIIGGWSDLGVEAGEAEDIMQVEDVPYAWLFPRSAAVIHHGGCGTVAAVMGAGRPSILLPRISSQEHFAELLNRQNLTAGVFDADRLSVDDLVAAIDRAVSDANIIDSAQRWSRVLARDGGVSAAADIIESHACAIGV